MQILSAGIGRPLRSWSFKGMLLEYSNFLFPQGESGWKAPTVVNALGTPLSSHFRPKGWLRKTDPSSVRPNLKYLQGIETEERQMETGRQAWVSVRGSRPCDSL